MRSADKLCSVGIHHSIINIDKNCSVRCFSELCARNVYFRPIFKNLREFLTEFERNIEFERISEVPVKIRNPEPKKYIEEVLKFLVSKGLAKRFIMSRASSFRVSLLKSTRADRGTSRVSLWIAWITFNYYL